MIEFSKRQLEYLNTPRKVWNICGGAVRSGKSYITIIALPKRIIAHYSEPCLIVGKTLATIERNILRPLREFYGADIGEIKSKADGGRYVAIYGKAVDCVGANDERSVYKIHGSEYGYVYCDELTTYPENFFRMLQSRLSRPTSEADATLNPENAGHYIKKVIDNPTFDGNYIHFTIYDNPFLPAEFVQRLENDYRGTYYFDRWILGKWVSTEGLVFPLFKRDKHFQTMSEYLATHQAESDRNIEIVIYGGDGATTGDSTAFIPILITSAGRLLIADIFLHNPKISGVMSNAQQIKLVRRWRDEVERKYNLTFPTKKYMQIDSAAADLVIEARGEFGRDTDVTPFGQKNIQQTVDMLNSAFALDMITILDTGGYYDYGREVFISGSNPLVEQLEAMIWKEGEDMKFDSKIENDAADAFRYGACSYLRDKINQWEVVK